MRQLTNLIDKLANYFSFNQSYTKDIQANKINKKALLIATIFIAFYCFLLVSFSSYSFYSDDGWDYDYILDGIFIWNGIDSFKWARFFPLANIDVNLLMLISKSPYIFYGFNALCFAVTFFAMFVLLSKTSSKNLVNLATMLIISTMLGYVTIIFALAYPERLQLVFTMLFILASLLIYVFNSRSYPVAIFGIICFNALLYLKEPNFICFGGGASILLLESYKLKNKFKLIYSSLLILSCIVFISLYFIIVHLLGSVESIYDNGTGAFSQISFYIRGLITQTINHSFIVFLLSGVVFYRLYLVLIKKQPLYAFYDALLVSSYLYFLFFQFAKMYAITYLAPCYFIAALPVVYFLWEKGYIKKLAFKILFALSFIIFLLVNVPESIYHYSQLKFYSKQFHSGLEFLDNYSKNNEKFDIYFDGIGRGAEIYNDFLYLDFIRFNDRIYNINADLKTDMPNGEDRRCGESKRTYSLCVNDEVTKPKSGDIVILSRDSHLNPQERIAYLDSNADLIFESNEPFSLPNIKLRSLLALIASKINSNLSILQENQNRFRLPTQLRIYKIR